MYFSQNRRSFNVLTKFALSHHAQQIAKQKYEAMAALIAIALLCASVGASLSAFGLI
jgi:hypothetical protein